jgi:hypothetical protein
MTGKIAEAGRAVKVIGISWSPMLRSYLITEDGGRAWREVCRGKNGFPGLFPELLPLFSECVAQVDFGCSLHGHHWRMLLYKRKVV